MTFGSRKETAARCRRFSKQKECNRTNRAAT